MVFPASNSNVFLSGGGGPELHNSGRYLTVARPLGAQLIQHHTNANIGTGQAVVTLKKNWYEVVVDGLREGCSTVDGMFSFPGTLYLGVNRITGGTYRVGSGLCAIQIKWLCK